MNRKLIGMILQKNSLQCGDFEQISPPNVKSSFLFQNTIDKTSCKNYIRTINKTNLGSFCERFGPISVFETKRNCRTFKLGEIMIDDMKENKKSYYETHKEEKKAYQREYKKSHKEKIRTFRKNDVNSLGQTKDSVRHKSQNYLKKYGTKIAGYEIHHCCGYTEPYKFIYCSKELHLLIHSYLRQHNIDVDSDHYEQIKHLLDNSVVLYGIV